MKLNIGCYKDIKEGYLNLDIKKFNDRVDIVHDITKFPYPFKDNKFTEIYARFVLEHISADYTTDIFEEFARIVQNNGRIKITVPYGLEWLRGIDHKRGFTDFTFVDLCNGRKYNTESNFNIVSVKFIPSYIGKLIPNFKVTKVFREGKYFYSKGFRERVAEFVNGIVKTLEVELEVIKK